MKTTRGLLVSFSLVIWFHFSGAALAGSRETATVEAAGEVVDALAAIPLKGIPPTLFKEAQGVAIFPGVLKAGFFVGGRFGHGVLLVREKDDSWGPPTFLRIRGGSLGFQVGAQSTDLILLFKTKDGVDRILQGKRKVTLGADLAVAAGPVGRQAEAATDAQLRAEIYSYSRSRGLFAGLALEGAGVLADPTATQEYNRSQPSSVTDKQTGKQVRVTPPDVTLRQKLATLSKKEAAPPAGPASVPVRQP